MPHSPEKKTLGVTVTNQMRDRIKRVAEMKHWSVSQTLGLFIDAYWSQWEKDMGVVEDNPKPTAKKRSKSVP